MAFPNLLKFELKNKPTYYFISRILNKYFYKILILLILINLNRKGQNNN